MAESVGLHEPAEHLSARTIDRHRAILSIHEEPGDGSVGNGALSGVAR